MDWGGGTALGSGITKSTSFDVNVKLNLPLDKSFSELTDKELLKIVTALDNNLITVDSLNWKVGDSRTVSLSSFQTYSDSTSSTTTQSAQIAQLVIQNIGGKTFNGNGTGLDGQTCHYVVGFKDNVCKSLWGASKNRYLSSLIQPVENNVYNALPADVKACFKKFDVVIGVYNGYESGGASEPIQQYFTSPAEKEIFGSRTYSTSREADALTQFTYYKTSANRKHTNIESYWWERSPNYASQNNACRVYSDGSANIGAVFSDVYGISPFGCI